ncbi:hypothetical protein AGABI1DRAFT_114518 [Agaricus bisporus var. burnettii JB137-S8]|uniref:Uncharacterized protein n=1 Tax=Agaricus bisporus var. burnettii (strain JB137-S8 / ATCC MYA-4627 / FGSC 10392) TaxID=597362 RepID=K5X7P3_AGABU|nr:uncharacterized protein AGABI1DRAFT_114518 [Agaricus bisporus var. burnettii JB137-S8]EKM79002.1 hypothetical protein AGABI1DRAFT_114518 [Agaricus bisporus var. burnettii JB137-S8]
MNSQVTLTNNSTSVTFKGQVRLLYKRSDLRNALLLENGVPRYFLATSQDGVSKVKISDAARNAVVDVERRSFSKDTFRFANRYDGKAVKVADVLRKAPSTSDGCAIFHFPRRVYLNELSSDEGRWRSTPLMLYEESSSTPVAWTEHVSGSEPTWALIVDNQVECVMDYVLASFFYYVKFELDSIDGWENMDSRAAYLSMK